jgi:hypothetical protein
MDTLRIKTKNYYPSNCTRCLFMKVYNLILDASRMYGSAASLKTVFGKAVFFPLTVFFLFRQTDRQT